MNAKRDELSRIQEIYDLITQTQAQMASLDFGKERFLNPVTDEDDLISEGIMNRVFRIAEEAGALSDETAREFGFERHAVSGVRNRLAHAYGDVDRDIIWNVIANDFEELLNGCCQYCDERGLALE